MPTVSASQLSKLFGNRKVIQDLTCTATVGAPLAIIGANGSGKTTTLQIMAGLQSPSAGSVLYENAGQSISATVARSHIAFVAPYGNLYDMLTADEHLRFFTEVAGKNLTGKEIDHSLARVGLKDRQHDRAREYSSGMKQRLKFAIGLCTQPSFFFIDEPSAHLDQAGKEIVAELIRETSKHIAVVIATNEQEDLNGFSSICRLD